MRWIPLAVFGRMNEGIRKGAFLFWTEYAGCMEPAVSLLAGMPVCYIYRQQEGLTERTLAWATSRRLTDEVRSSLHSRSASTTRSFRLANTKAGTQRTGSQGNVRHRGFGALSTGLRLQMVVASGSRFQPARREGITDMRYFVTGHEMLLYLSGDREEHKEECCFELPDFESKEEAVAAAREFIKEHKNAVNDQKHGIGSVTYWTAEVTRCIEDEDFGWLPCDADGATEDGHGLVPADATAEYICTLDGSREERAFELAKNEYLAWLEHKEDRYTTVYGYMD